MVAVAKYCEGGPGEQLLRFMCPGCKEHHVVRVSAADRPCWGFNHNMEKPTLTPSVLVRSGHYVTKDTPGGCYCDWPDKDEFPEMKCRICHSFVTDGMIQFLSDSTHELAGQTVALPPIEV